MRAGPLMLGALLAAATLVAHQTSNGATQTSSSDTHQKRKQITISGCLNRNSHKQYELVDKKGVHNLLYGSRDILQSHVGQSVTLIGTRSATPSTDTGTARPMPHFEVSEVKAASGKCNK